MTQTDIRDWLGYAPGVTITVCPVAGCAAVLAQRRLWSHIGSEDCSGAQVDAGAEAQEVPAR